MLCLPVPPQLRDSPGQIDIEGYDNGGFFYRHDKCIEVARAVIYADRPCEAPTEPQIDGDRKNP